MMINDLVADIHENAKDKGWWDEPRSPLDIHMLIVSEVAEATEAVRKDWPDIFQVGGIKEPILPGSILWKDTGKHEGEAVELADAIIRILDYAGHKGWDMEKILLDKICYNLKRSHRHGGKKY